MASCQFTMGLTPSSPVRVLSGRLSTGFGWLPTMKKAQVGQAVLEACKRWLTDQEGLHALVQRGVSTAITSWQLGMHQRTTVVHLLLSIACKWIPEKDLMQSILVRIGRPHVRAWNLAPRTGSE